MKKIIDTNILLDYTFEQIIDSLKEENEKLELLIPLEVIRELDKFKVGMENINTKARQAIRFIEEQRKKGDLLIGVEIEDGVELKIKTKEIILTEEDLNSSPDARILLEGTSNEIKDDSLTLVSSDIHARIMAGCFGLKAEEFMLNNEVKEYSSKITIDVTDEELNTLYRSYKSGLPTTENYRYNEFMEMKDSTGGLHYGIYDKDTKSIKRLKDNYTAFGVKPRINGNQLPIPEQSLLMHFLLDRDIEFLSAIGCSGCGKTFLTLACALEQTLGKKPIYDKIIIMRPLTAIDRDIGALPGDKIEKLTPWMGSIIDNLSILLAKQTPDDILGGACKDEASYMGVGDKINSLIDMGKLELEALTFIRGRSIPKAFILIDDAQNLSIKEATTIVTRVGEGSKLVFLGDISPAQIDNPRLNQYNNGLTYVTNKLAGVDRSIASMTMNKVVRSKLASLGVEYL